MGDVHLDLAGEVLEVEAIVLELREATHDVLGLAGGAEEARQGREFAVRAVDGGAAVEGGLDEHAVAVDALLKKEEPFAVELDLGGSVRVHGSRRGSSWKTRRWVS